MKLTKIASICKRHLHLSVLGTSQAQWISVGAAAYPAYGLPMIQSQEELLTVLDVPEVKRDSFQVSFAQAGFDERFEDSVMNELPLRNVNYSFVQRGSVLMPLFTADGRVYWINECYLAPVEDEKDLTFWLRETRPDMYAVAVKAGYEIVALIGVRIASSETEESMRDVLGACAQSRAKGYRIQMDMVEKYHGYQLPVTGFSLDELDPDEADTAEQERLV